MKDLKLIKKGLLKVQEQNCLGIYLSENAATVVCLCVDGKLTKALDCFSVSVEPHEEHMAYSATEELVGLIAKQCEERKIQFTRAFVALDCGMFMQHSVHSEFADSKQIASTVRFDTEEALAMDVVDIAIAFKIRTSNDTGSDLTVFTAKKKLLTDILNALQANNIDPVSIEPDIHCLSRFIGQGKLGSDFGSEGVFFGMLTERNGYFVITILSNLVRQFVLRTFVINQKQQREMFLRNQIPVSMALLETEEPISQLKIFDSTDSVDCGRLSESLAMDVNKIDFSGSGFGELSGCAGEVDFAIAYGAALSHLEKAESVDFRNDFAPYQGRKLQLQKTLKLVSISAVLFIMVVGLYLQIQLMRQNGYSSQLRSKFEKQYSSVMFGKKMPSRGSKLKAESELSKELRRIKDLKSGQLSVTGEKSGAVKLTIVLEVFNNAASKTNLNIESISITAKSIVISGDTPNRKKTLEAFAEIKKKFAILQQRLESKGGKDNFSITIAPEK